MKEPLHLFSPRHYIFFFFAIFSLILIWMNISLAKIGATSMLCNMVVEDSVALSTVKKNESDANSSSFDEDYSIMRREQIITDDQIITSRTIPDFDNDEAGGILIFIHVAKTGGTTVRGLFEDLAKDNPSRFDYSWFNYNAKILKQGTKGKEKVEKLRKGEFEEIEERLKGNSTSTLLLEVHGSQNGGMHELSPRLDYWRTLCEQSNKPFFAFTILREPQSYMFSYFRFFHIGCKWCDRLNMEQFDDPTAENLLKVVTDKPNIQCKTLLYADAIGKRPKDMTEKECQFLYFTLQESLDWVGTTENLSNETLPLIHKMVGKEVHASEPILNQRKKLPFEKAMSDDELQSLSDILAYDVELYQNTQRDYVFSDFYPELLST